MPRQEPVFEVREAELRVIYRALDCKETKRARVSNPARVVCEEIQRFSVHLLSCCSLSHVQQGIDHERQPHIDWVLDPIKTPVDRQNGHGKRVLYKVLQQII